MDSSNHIRIGEMTIRVVVSDELIESFDAEIPCAGLGPDLHYHSGMDEIFFVQSGKVAITYGDMKVVASAGMIVRAIDRELGVSETARGPRPWGAFGLAP